MVRSVKLIIYGKVQGVFFRKSAKIEADKLGLSGWVKNKSDGSVEAVVRGEDKGIEKFINWCRKGPPFATVDEVVVTKLKQDIAEAEFSIHE